MNNKEKYKLFCSKEPVPIFLQYWWMDSVSDKWDVILIEKGGEVFASLVYSFRLLFGKKIIVQPFLTQTNGVYIKYPIGQKYYKKLSWEKEMMGGLIERLEKIGFLYYDQNFHHTITNWLPFYWKGYEQTTRYTYMIDKNIPLDLLEKQYETDIRRRRRRKAEKLNIKVVESSNVEQLYDFIKMTFKRRNEDLPYSFELVNKVYFAAKENDSCKILFAKTANDVYIASALLVWDKDCVYYLIGGIDTDKRDLGGMDMILHHSVTFALQNKKDFDFEGSMIEPIEKYFRSFGAKQVTYNRVFKGNILFRISKDFLVKNKKYLKYIKRVIK